MLHIRHIPWYLLLSFFLVPACDKENTALFPIEKQPSLSTITASNPVTEDPNAWSVGDIIGLSAYRTGSQELYAGLGHKSYHTTDGLTFHPIDSKENIFYPGNGTGIDLVAFYPYKTLAHEHQYEIDLRNQAIQKNIDFLYSNNAKNQHKSVGNSHLIFQHALSKFVVEALPGTGLDANALTNLHLSITGVYTQASFLLSDGSFQPEGTLDTLVMHTEGIYSHAILLPGALSSARLHVGLASGEIFEGPLPELNLLAGTRYQYTVRIHKTHIELQTSEIAPWEGLENAPGSGSSNEIYYKPGDYFPNPYDPFTAMGVVYWIVAGSNGRSGKILSFGSSSQSWSTSEPKTIRAFSIYNGVFNMEAALAEDASLQSLPAFLWCTQEGNDWYLPARYELHILREQWENHATINTALELAGGEILCNDDHYWSATESNGNPSDQAEVYHFSDKGWYSTEKTAIQRVRAIKSF